MAYYNVCPRCGNNLDPGEKCTCLEEKEGQRDFFSRCLVRTGSGQLAFAFGETETVKNSDRRESIE